MAISTNLKERFPKNCFSQSRFSQSRFSQSRFFQSRFFQSRFSRSDKRPAAAVNRPKQALKQHFLQVSLLSSLVTGLALTLTGSPATAATFIFDSNTLAGNTTVGNHESITTTFDDGTDLFTWSITLSRNESNNRLADGGWLVVNAGGNPKADDQESVIFYLDGKVGQVSAYDYSGTHRSHSWRESRFLGATALTVENAGNERTLSFAFDMSQINNMTDTFGPNWKGTAFDEQVGIWFHGVDGLMVDYTGNGDLAKFSYTHQGWYDTNAKQTVSTAVLGDVQDIPEPSALVALGLFAAVLMFKSRVMEAHCDDSVSTV